MRPAEGVEVGQPAQAFSRLVALVGRPVGGDLRCVALVGEEGVYFEVVGIWAVVVRGIAGLGLSFGMHVLFVEFDADVVELHGKHVFLLLFLLVFADLPLIGRQLLLSDQLGVDVGLEQVASVRKRVL